MPDFTQIKLAIDGPVATITLHRPEKMNAFTHQMRDEIIEAIDITDGDDAVRAVIVTGEGERAFCAGADLTPPKNPDGTDKHVFSDPATVDDLSDPLVRDGGGRLVLRLFNSQKPLIGACNGVAVGVGATMQLPFDMRLCSDNARFGFVFAKRGITPEACSSWFLPRLVGMSKALEWCMTGRLFDARAALEAGLVRSVHPQGELMDAARTLANEIAENAAPLSVAMTRAMLWRLSAEDHPMKAHRIDSRAIYRLSRGPDAKEGIASFLEKRPPEFTGKVSTDMPDFYPWWQEPEYK
ncbi:crotonase/enoyl-CoA hydratase family protein [Alteriqipengyuania lutimaris]|uniref:Enoyl-CoA hydratase n=1 Tax=Alteriqipengyuania lutimaris TaxID=1538146 RepID=A0A395LPP5_9SPHN|nr:crotonase/enoyl-CoA hydratase family protein [Alteriqipengyuania lutimaris]MBB3033449.1 enoyl-CoA hydratase/carnithine racemase [Alteriqipengyuania lutimaris]RDS77534.1 enoyl-CoA hydratase [Alteriqipengyuania lutimaris]